MHFLVPACRRFDASCHQPGLSARQKPICIPAYGWPHRHSADHRRDVVAVGRLLRRKIWPQARAVAWLVETLRALLFAVYTSYPILIVGQCLGGISAAGVTVVTILMIADMTTGTLRFNLVQGFIGTVIAIAAAISTGTTGFLFEKFGHLPGFLVLGVAAAAATLLFWAALTETRPGKYLD